MASYHSRVVERRARAANDETLLLNRCEQLVCPAAAAAAAAAVVVVRRRPAPRLRVVARVFVSDTRRILDRGRSLKRCLTAVERHQQGREARGEVLGDLNI